MGGSDRFCVICGGPHREIDYDTVDTFYYEEKEIDDDDEREKLSKKFPYDGYKWLNDLYLITDKDVVIPTSRKDYDDYGSFIINGMTINISSMEFNDERDKDVRAILCHRWCYKLIKKTFNYGLKYTDLVPYLADTCGNLFERDCYFEMGKYIGQFGEPLEIHDENSWLLDTDNKRNRARIVAIWAPIIYKIKYV